MSSGCSIRDFEIRIVVLGCRIWDRAAVWAYRRYLPCTPDSRAAWKHSVTEGFKVDLGLCVGLGA